jgi:hypothetical protein
MLLVCLLVSLGPNVYYQIESVSTELGHRANNGFLRDHVRLYWVLLRTALMLLSLSIQREHAHMQGRLTPLLGKLAKRIQSRRQLGCCLFWVVRIFSEEARLRLGLDHGLLRGSTANDLIVSPKRQHPDDILWFNFKSNRELKYSLIVLIILPS